MACLHFIYFSLIRATLLMSPPCGSKEMVILKFKSSKGNVMSVCKIGLGVLFTLVVSGCAGAGQGSGNEPAVRLEPPVVNSEGTRDTQEACIPKPSGPTSC